ncbi:hypothetical protein JNUCC83_08405 [Vagococcus sp. JNUCC 83]
MEINDFLDIKLLGNKFVAVKEYEPVADRETGAIVAYRVNISLQDDKSPFYMEMISVKIKTTTPTISVDEMKTNKTRDIELEGLNMGQFNGRLWFTVDNVRPVLNKELKI